MCRPSLSLILTSCLIFRLCSGEFSNGGLCSNPALSLLETCWLREKRDQYSLQPRVETRHSEKPETAAGHNSTISAPNGPPPYPWTHHPICNSVQSDAESIFCVYTSTSFAEGRGISIIGTPQSVELISRNRVFHPSLTTSKQPDDKKFTSPPYEVKQLPGRGYGLLANTTLNVGDEVLAHTPVIVIQAILDEHLDRKELWDLFRVAVKQLPQSTGEMFLALQGHNDSGGDEGGDMYSRFTTNAFEIYDYAAVFPETARLNHDCRPNARYYFDKRTFTHHVHATRTISPGEEITISYLSHYLTSHQRSTKIPKTWSFTCTCHLCSSPPSILAASDARLDEMSDIEFDIMEGKGTVEERVVWAERLVNLYEKEGLEAPAAKAYEIVARELRKKGGAGAEGDLERARMFAGKAVKIGALWLGPGSEDFRRMVRLEEELETELERGRKL